MTLAEEASVAVGSLLGTLGITSATEWEVLLVLVRQPGCPVELEPLARLLEAEPERVGAVLDRLEGRGLLTCTSSLHGVRQSRLDPLPSRPEGEALASLLRLTNCPAGRDFLKRELDRPG